ncbi:hypothetical protein ACFOUY_12280 [Pedobacter jamesrossensis]|uniref:Uncharacterized protein n=2 Tax=Pedobacter jamesrossensis TaxID=1908238 RepID=A0ABV8NLY5_9SPHI
MRITYQEIDHSYKVMTKVINEHTQEIKINLDGEELTLKQNEKREWDVIEQTVGDELGLIKAVIRSVILRYRL